MLYGVFFQLYTRRQQIIILLTKVNLVGWMENVSILHDYLKSNKLD